MNKPCWIRKNDSEKMSFESVIKQITLAPKGSVFVIEGPFTCGKTTLVNSIPVLNKKRVVCNSFIETLVEIIKMPTERSNAEIVADLNKCDLFCLEDVDGICSKEITQDFVSECLKKIAADSIIVITGDNISNTMPSFLNAFEGYIHYSFYEE